MPLLNGAGPQGAGPMTGRGMGRCNTTGAAAPFYGRGGRGFGGGRGNGFGYGGGNAFGGYNTAPELTPQQQKEILNQQKSFLKRELTSIDEQIKKL